MKGYKLIKDTPHHVEVKHPDGSSFLVAKHGLSLPMLKTLSEMPKHLAEGTPRNKYSSELEAAADENPELASQPLPNIPLVTGQPAGTAPERYSPGYGPKSHDSLSYLTSGDSDAAATPLENASPGVPSEPTQAPSGMPPAAAPQEPASDPFGGYLQNMQGVAAQQQAAIGQKGNAEANMYQEQAEATARNLEEQQTAAKAFQDHWESLNKEQENIQKAYAEGKINPNRVWQEATTGNKIAMVAGMLVSGLGANAGQGNMAMNIINKTIDNDIDAQKANLGKQENLLRMNMQKHNNLISAEQVTRLNMLASYKGAIDLAAQKAGTPMAQANAQMGKLAIDQQMAGIQQDVAKQRMVLNMFRPQTGAPQTDGVDPNKFNAAFMLGAIPKEMQSDFLKEYQAYNNQRQKIQTMNYLFDKVKSLQTPGQRLGDAYNSNRQIKMIVDSMGNEYAKDVDGRVNQTEVDTFSNNFPGLFDNAETSEQGKSLMADMVKAKGGVFSLLQSKGLLNPNDPYISTRGTDSAALAGGFNKEPNQQRAKTQLVRGQK